MMIRRLNIKSFGKIHEKELEFSPGINVLYGENESGKTTIHTFIRGMFYGLTRLRGRAARNDPYTTYEPWADPASYGGTIWVENKGKNYRLSRNFHKSAPSAELLCEDDGRIIDIEKEGLGEILGGVSEAIYDNTVSVGQLKSVTGQDLVRELQNYMASYQGTGDSSIDLGRAMQMLKMSRKGFQVQEDRKKKEVRREQEKIAANMQYVREEMQEIEEKRSEINLREEALYLKGSEGNGEAYLDERILQTQKKRKRSLAMIAVGIVLCIGLIVAAALQFDSIFAILGALALTVVFCMGAVMYQMKIEREYQKRTRTKARWLSRQEKIKWNRDNLDEAYGEKETAMRNLQEEYREYEADSALPTMEQIEIDALNLAMETITGLSGSIHHQVGIRLRNRTSRILSEITGGKYQEILMDREFRMSVNTQDRIVPLERLSRGTLEQMYFALRMAAGELLCGGKDFPVILDDVFGMYDEERLLAVLRWLHQEQRQIIISTCHKREMELLDKAGIPYQKLVL